MNQSIPAILSAMRSAVGAPPIISNQNPFRVLISTVLSQRTRDENTAKAAKALFGRFHAPKELASASNAELERLIKPAGFYKVKARRIREISRLIAEDFKGKVPNDFSKLVSLPGVGRKTANCVLVYGFGESALPVDTHVHRISNRIGLVETRTPAQTEQALQEVIPKKHWLELNHLMVSYGQKVCLPVKPKCLSCEIRPNCRHFLSRQAEKQV